MVRQFSDEPIAQESLDRILTGTKRDGQCRSGI
jgi:hypothetical protein